MTESWWGKKQSSQNLSGLEQKKSLFLTHSACPSESQKTVFKCISHPETYVMEPPLSTVSLILREEGKGCKIKDCPLKASAVKWPLSFGNVINCSNMVTLRCWISNGTEKCKVLSKHSMNPWGLTCPSSLSICASVPSSWNSLSLLSSSLWSPDSKSSSYVPMLQNMPQYVTKE